MKVICIQYINAGFRLLVADTIIISIYKTQCIILISSRFMFHLHILSQGEFFLTLSVPSLIK